MTVAIQTGSGIPGWALLTRSIARQRALVANDGPVRMAAQHYRERIGAVRSADALMDDYRLLDVTLRAFGLGADIGNRAFIRQVLESDLADDRSLANRLSDSRYLRLAERFGFGVGGAGRTAQDGFADRVVADYVEAELETRVGAAEPSLRLALSARRTLPDLAARDSSARTKWFAVLGDPPLRELFQTAFGFGPAHGRLPIDRQLRDYADAAERMLGRPDIAQFTDPGKVETLTRHFLMRDSLRATADQGRFSVALTLLRGGAPH
ncbi:Protein of unknown function [Paracoccus isoporae]|uniref:DUF1217 domain-containing protein n=1 Tax=Paracoccus isoporae TaxID=591205 RepID=A0A1G6YJQ1_9RHOB|nr:DUF1217 domain-containing protein [Paracoccus isoporae]SDD90608.1 Protein of unknown function [Paracoccus isoporae]